MKRWRLATGWIADETPDGIQLYRERTLTRFSLPAEITGELKHALQGMLGASDISSRSLEVLERLSAHGIAIIEIEDRGLAVAQLHSAPRRRSPHARRTGPARLSSSVFLRAGSLGVELRSAIVGDTVILISPEAVQFVAGLLADNAIPEPEDPIHLELLELIEQAGFMAPEPSGWEFHDLVFHSSSRLDTARGDYGAKPVPVANHGPVRRPDGRCIPLNHAELPNPRMSLDEALISRRTIRSHALPAIGLEELSALFSRSVRVQRTEQTASGKLAWRSIPTAGARSGIGVIVLAKQVDALTEGTYEYDALKHTLIEVGRSTPAMNQWVGLAERLTGIPSDTIQAVVLFVLDYSQAAERYNAIVYASALKEVGAAIQAMGLVSTELGLSFCPMGGGFSSTLGLGNGHSLPVIGEAVLGRAPASVGVHND